MTFTRCTSSHSVKREVEQLRVADDAGAVHEDVERAELRDGEGDRRLGVGLAAHLGDGGPRPLVARPAALGQAGLVAIGPDDEGTLVEEPRDDRPPDPRGGSGDDCHLARETSVGHVTTFRVKGRSAPRGSSRGSGRRPERLPRGVECPGTGEKAVHHVVVGGDLDRHARLAEPLRVGEAVVAERVVARHDEQCRRQPSQVGGEDGSTVRPRARTRCRRDSAASTTPSRSSTRRGRRRSPRKRRRHAGIEGGIDQELGTESRPYLRRAPAGPRRRRDWRPSCRRRPRGARDRRRARLPMWRAIGSPPSSPRTRPGMGARGRGGSPPRRRSRPRRAPGSGTSSRASRGCRRPSPPPWKKATSGCTAESPARYTRTGIGPLGPGIVRSAVVPHRSARPATRRAR